MLVMIFFTQAAKSLPLNCQFLSIYVPTWQDQTLCHQGWLVSSYESMSLYSLYDATTTSDDEATKDDNNIL